MANYVGDFRCLLPTDLAGDGLAFFSKFCKLRGTRLKAKKPDVGRQLNFSGLSAQFPGPDTAMPLAIDLPVATMAKWSAAIRLIAHGGEVSRAVLDSLTGSFSCHTYIFGCFGRDAIHPSYRNLYSQFYRADSSPVGRPIFEWLAYLLPRGHPRLASRADTFPYWIVYSDADTPTLIMAFAVFRRADCIDIPRAFVLTWVAADARRGDIFQDTNLIYGLGELALTLTTHGPELPLHVSSVT